MKDATAPVFKASFADFKLVKTRSCAQLIFELPIEQADAALQTLGGLPRAATEVWAAICRIDPKKAASEPRVAPAEAPETKEQRKLADMSLGQRAGMFCADPEFRRFVVGQQEWSWSKHRRGLARLPIIAGHKAQ